MILKFYYCLCFLLYFNSGFPQMSKLFKDSLDESSCFFFTGECHLKKDYRYSLVLFENLYQHHRVRKIIIEFPNEFEFGFNKYINDPAPKNTDYLDLFATEMLKNQEDCKEFLEKIRLLNMSVSSDKEKIHIICPDINRSIYYALLSIASSTDPEKINNLEIYESFMKIFKLKRRHFDDNQYEKAVTLVYEIKKFLDVYENDFRNIYKDDFVKMKKTIDKLHNTTVLYQTYKVIPDSIREQIMFENIFDDYQQNPEVSYYGNFGLYHTMLNCHIDDVTLGGLQVKNSLAQRLNETKELKGKVVSMVYYYAGGDDKCMWEISGNSPLSPFEAEKFKNIDFSNGNVIIQSKDLVKSKDLETKFQYLIISNK